MRIQVPIGSFVLAAVALACAPASGPPEIVLDRTACDSCGMLVSERTHAAAYRIEPGAPALVFDDIGCMLRSWRAETDVSVALAWVSDSLTEQWLDARQAWYVRSVTLPTPMGSNTRAVATREAAELLASGHEGADTLSFDELSADRLATHDGHEEGAR